MNYLKNINNMDTIQKNLYSRQIGTIGLETQQKLSQLSIFVYGLDSIGFEVIKCLTLMGVKKIFICPVINSKKKFHIGRTFHIRTQDDLKNIEHHSIKYFSELNPYVKFEFLTLGLMKEKNIDVFIQTKLDKSKPIHISKYCSQNNIKYILAINISYSGFIFCDFGKNHTIKNWDGERRKHCFVLEYKNIKNNAYLKLDDPENQFYPGISVKLNISNETIFKIISKSDNFIVLDQKINLNELSKIKNICIEEFKFPIKLTHISLEQYIKTINVSPNLMTNIKSEKNAIKIVNDFKKIIAFPTLLGKDSLNLEYVFNSKYELSPLGMALGSIVSSEVMKIPGKYTPISQDYILDYSELKPNTKDLYQTIKDKNHEDIYRLLSKKLIRKLENSNVFIAGCGALGCEYLKILSMLNVGKKNSKTNKQSKITVTDMDQIELSNLNRQFLFRQSDIGTFKSKTAHSKINYYYPNITIESHDKIIDPSTDKFFNRNFWQKQDLIINALDNIIARQFIDNKCLIYDKPLIEAGTLGTKCNIQMIIPKKTKTYSETQDPPEKSIPMCTIKNFPYKIEHCIEWSMEIFHSYLNDFIIDLREYSLGKDDFKKYLSEVNNSNIVNQKLDNLLLFIELINTHSFNKAITMYSINIFYKIFINPIKQILHSFPINHKNSDGEPFWSGNKIAPKIIDIHDNYQLLIQFTQYFSRLICDCLNRQYQTEKVDKQVFSSNHLINYTPSDNYQFKIKDSDKIEQGNKIEDLETIIDMKISKLLMYNLPKDMTFKPIELEKDNDNNGHIDLLTNISNLRAISYSIPQTNHLECKLISGKVIPALSTTTTLVTSFAILEALKYLHFGDNISKLSDYYVNMGINTYLQSQPQHATKIISGKFNSIYGCNIKTKPEIINIWDKKIISKKTDKVYNVLDLVTYIEDEFEISIDMLNIGDDILYCKHNSVQKNSMLIDQYTKLNKNISEYLEINVASFSEDSLPIVIPKVLYCWEI